MNKRVVVGSRGSALALVQTQLVVEKLRALFPKIEFAVMKIKTEGDRELEAILEKICGNESFVAPVTADRGRKPCHTRRSWPGREQDKAFGEHRTKLSKGVFTKEIEEALLAGKIDLAVHSLKDLPTELPKGLMIGAVLERADPRDVLISREGASLAELPPNARIGTDSQRRRAQLLAYRRDLQIRSIRGNVDTRLRKLDGGQYDAIVLAAAGLARLGLQNRVTEYLSMDLMLPAPGQGTLAIEVREDDERLRELIRHLDHAPTRAAIEAERAFLRHVGGGCRVPIAGNMGVALPKPGFLEGLRELTRQHGALLIFDEVITGFRVSLGGAQQLYGIQPDLTCLGKIIGGGLPIGAYGGRQEIMQLVAPLGQVYQAGTLSGNPLAMTAGIETLKLLQQSGVYEKLAALADRLIHGLTEAAKKANVPVQINRVGSMLTLFFTEKEVYDEAPLVIYWEATRACDLACRHCRAEAIPQRDPDELTTQEAKALFCQIKEFRSSLLVITGGDPLKRPDLFELLACAQAISLKFALSLDGSDAEKHDAFRQVRGCFDWTLRAARWARQALLPLQINTAVTAETAEDLPQLYNLVESLGAARWSLFFLVPVGRGRLLRQISSAECERLLQWLYELSQHATFQIKTTEAHHYRRVFLQRERLKGKSIEEILRSPSARGFGVRDGNGVIFVSQSGEIYPSGFLPLPAGSVRRDDLVEIYRNSQLFRDLRDARKLKSKCGRCLFKGVCGGSRARAYAMTGDYLESDPLCAYQPQEVG